MSIFIFTGSWKIHIHIHAFIAMSVFIFTDSWVFQEHNSWVHTFSRYEIHGFMDFNHIHIYEFMLFTFFIFMSWKLLLKKYSTKWTSTKLVHIVHMNIQKSDIHSHGPSFHIHEPDIHIHVHIHGVLIHIHIHDFHIHIHNYSWDSDSYLCKIHGYPYSYS